jgi:ubiquinone/menaquinone biosynthesis C-methylase UbiE
VNNKKENLNRFKNKINFCVANKIQYFCQRKEYSTKNEYQLLLEIITKKPRQATYKMQNSQKWVNRKKNLRFKQIRLSED